MDDYQFGLEIRRALLQIAWALFRRFGCVTLRVILTGERPCPAPPEGTKGAAPSRHT